MQPTEHVSIRPARPDDRADVFAMVATVWAGNDYIPYVWEEWLADANGPLLVGELEGRPVALAKLSDLGSGEDWFHGLRVEPHHRGKGIAGTLLRHCVALSRERGAGVLRYLTDEDNHIMHHIGEQCGFRLAYAPVWYNAPVDPGAPAAVSLPPAQLPLLVDNLTRSTLLARTHGLYSYRWRAFALTEERLSEHLARGEVLALANEPAWAIVVPNDEGGVWLAHVEGPGAGLERLCQAIQVAPEQHGVSVRALLPPDAPCIPALLAAGFSETSDRMRLYELRHARIG